MHISYYFIVESSNCLIFRLFHRRIVKLSHFQIVKLSHFQIVKLHLNPPVIRKTVILFVSHDNMVKDGEFQQITGLLHFTGE